jgi:hypothetical protein
MWERHYEIMRRLISGDRPCDIAASFNMTDTRMSIIVNSPLFQARLLEMRERANAGAADVMQRITRASIDAMTILECAIKAKRGDREFDLKPMEQVRVAQDLLDRAGYGAVQKSFQISGALTNDDLETIRKRREMRVVSEQSSSVAVASSVLP